jgi:hypothetical protein
MGTIIVLGHGYFDPAGGGYPPEVLIPPDTSLRFFSDAGQPLVLPAYRNDAGEVISDYNKVVNVWEHFKEDESPIPPRWVTYNFRLSPEDSDEDRELAGKLPWGADVVTLPEGADKFYLCTGTPDTCPTPALNVQQQDYEQRGVGSPVPDDRWHHHCKGILATHAGNDLIWCACTSIRLDAETRAELPLTMTSGSAGPGMDVAGWYPTDADWSSIIERNRQNVKDTPDGEVVPVSAGGVLVLIGRDHAVRPVEYVRRQGDLEEGQITVNKGGFADKGTLEISGISAKQSEVQMTIEQFSDKEIVFT